MNRNQLMLKLRAEGYPCPGCWEPLAETDGQGHHALWREAQAYTPEQKDLLWDKRNIVRVHHDCHQREGAAFQTRCIILLMHRQNWECSPFVRLRQDLQDAGILETNLSYTWIWMGVYQRRFLASQVTCPECNSNRVHNFHGPELSMSGMRQDSLCWTCLTRFVLDYGNTS